MPLITSTTISDLEREVIVEEIFGLAKKQYKLRELCRVIPMKELHATVRIATSLTGTPKVPEGVEAPLNSQSYTTVTFDLWKNVVHVALPVEAKLKSAVDVIKLHVEDAARELAKMENDQIAAVMQDAPNITGADWGNSANDPLDDIMAAKIAIMDSDQGFVPDVIAMHPLVYGDLVSNDNIVNSLERSTISVTGELEKIAGLKIVVDRALPSTSAFVLDTKAPALILGDGPEVTEDYGGRGAFLEGFAVAKFLEPKLVLSSAIREITNVHA